MVSFSVLNELSLPHHSVHSVESSFIGFFKLIKALKEKNFRKLRTEQPTKYWEILDGVFFPQYVNQLNNRELKDRLRVFLANNEVFEVESPLVSSVDGNEELLSAVYQYKEENHFGGLACAQYWNTLAVSFNSSEEWNNAKVFLTKDGSICELRHASQTDHLNEHQDYFKHMESEYRLSITKNNFWDLKDKHFSKFDFVKSVKDNVRKLDEQVFRQFVSILRDIETGIRPLKDLDISGESISTNSNHRLKLKRTFEYQGRSYYFESHIKNLPKGYRVHYVELNSKIIIGYVGPHLPTASSS